MLNLPCSPDTRVQTVVSSNPASRLARRGGVKRISGQIYDDIRSCLRDRLTLVSNQSIRLP